MMIRVGLVCAASMIFAGCYNNPNTTLKHPGEGPANHMSRPAVGPGTVDGGSTAGPQPAARKDHGGEHTEPTHSGAVPGHPSPAVGNPASPQMHGEGQTPKGPASLQGNQKGVGERGPGAH